MESIYLLGAASPETIRMVQAVQASSPVSFPGLLDNDKRKHGTLFFGMPVLGGYEVIPGLAGPRVGFVSLVSGSTQAREETGRGIEAAGGQLVNLIHPTVDTNMVALGRGIYIQQGVQLGAQVELGDNSSIHIGAVVNHECRLGRSVFVAPSACIAGCCEIGDGVFVGVNATILPRLRIGNWATIGAGAVVTKNVPDHAVVVGNPARIVKFNERAD
ncbi:NeuD/PglB/VioB family sugar acetyltransferase [Rhizobium sp. Root1220]|uniref:NeuD/PglB/VioB family sugar acetyltransferase n=1 Tax=Rhizobium sp. Root1220 TaxID=1736432 RepID=UPI000701E14C|nr:NeuD/PglB/VioB family sugar acetyltransferase [Rhizobium sp. Root1220]KQV84490.1 transferase [Rhizobium sp. Root1220]